MNRLEAMARLVGNQQRNGLAEGIYWTDDVADLLAVADAAAHLSTAARTNAEPVPVPLCLAIYRINDALAPLLEEESDDRP